MDMFAGLTTKQKVVLSITSLLGISLIVLAIVLAINNNSQAPTNSSASVDACHKIGINYATYVPVAASNHDKAASLNMGYTLEIVRGPQDLQSTIDSFNYANSKGLIPIVRPCVGSSCGFSDVATYIAFLNQLGDALAGKEIMALAGPNEPLSEPWTGGTVGDPNSVGPGVATYMNSVISGVTKSNVHLLSPALNPDDPNGAALVNKMHSSGANFNGLYALAVNAYNRSSKKIGDYVTTVRNVFAALGITKPIILTETGIYEITEGTSRATAKTNLISQLSGLKSDSNILGYLLFNSFGLNTDSQFSYNVFSDTELAAISNGICTGDTGGGNEDDPPPPSGACQWDITKVRVRELDKDPVTKEYTCPLEEQGNPAGCRDWVPTATSNISRTAFEFTAFQCNGNDSCDDVAPNTLLTVTGAGFSGQQFTGSVKYRENFKGPGTITVTATTPGQTGAGCTGTATYLVTGDLPGKCKENCGFNFDGNNSNRGCETGLVCALVRGSTSFGCEDGDEHILGSMQYPSGTFKCVKESTPNIGRCGQANDTVMIITKATFDSVSASTCNYTAPSTKAPGPTTVKKTTAKVLPKTDLDAGTAIQLTIGILIMVTALGVYRKYGVYSKNSKN